MTDASRGAQNYEPGAAPPAPTKREHDFALVVGVNDYPTFTPLNGAVDDATAFYNWLCDPNGGGVDEEKGHAKLVTSTPDPKPKQEHVDAALRELIEAADAIGGGRRLYVYFSGHGAAARDTADGVALLLADWSVQRAKIGLSSARYRDNLVDFGLFEELVVVLDCCRSHGKSGVGQECSLTLELKTPPTSTQWLIVFACERNQNAYERLNGISWSGVFTRSLLEIFKRAAVGVPAGELEAQLEVVLANNKASQKAIVLGRLEPHARFGRRGTVASLRVTFKPTTKGIATLLGGKGEIIAEHDPADGSPWVVTLQEGYLYKLVHPPTQWKEMIDCTGSIEREL